jgi:hypothetical protein
LHQNVRGRGPRLSIIIQWGQLFWQQRINTSVFLSRGFLHGLPKWQPVMLFITHNTQSLERQKKKPVACGAYCSEWCIYILSFRFLLVAVHWVLRSETSKKGNHICIMRACT